MLGSVALKTPAEAVPAMVAKTPIAEHIVLIVVVFMVSLLIWAGVALPGPRTVTEPSVQFTTR